MAPNCFYRPACFNLIENALQRDDGDRGGRRDSGRKKDESGYREEKTGLKQEKTGTSSADERKKPAGEKPGPRDNRSGGSQKSRAEDRPPPKNRGNERSEPGFRNRNRVEKPKKDFPAADSEKPIDLTPKSAEFKTAEPVAAAGVAAQPDSTGNEPERRSGKSYLNKRRERQQERAAKEPDQELPA